MDSATVAVVALSIAVGFSFTEVLFRRRRRGLRYAVAMLLSTGLVLGFTRYVVQPYVQSTPAVRFSGYSELLAAMERLEPATRFQITPGGAAAYPGEFRRRSITTLAKHVWKSSDAAVVDLAQTLLRNAQVLQRQDPWLCAEYLFPTSDGEAVDYTRHLNEMAITADLAALAAALESAANATRSISTAADREPGMRTLRNRLSARYTTADFELFERRRRSLAAQDGAATCGMGIDLYREALALPSPQRAAALRHLMAV